VWSDSPYLACLKHSGLAAEIRMSAPAAEREDLDRISLLRSFPPGLRSLMGPKDAGAHPETDVA
jgi:hypothetical protein